MKHHKKAPDALQTTPHALASWSHTQLAQNQRRTAAALKGLDPNAKESLLRARQSLTRVVTAPICFAQKFERDPSTALCLIVVDRALGGEALPALDRLVDAAFREHEGDLIKTARALLDDIQGFSEDLAMIHRAIPLTGYEKQFSRHALEHAQLEGHDHFVDACLLAAEYLGDDLQPEDDQLADRAFLAWLLQAFPVAYPTFSVGERTRLLLGLAHPSPFVDAGAVNRYIGRVVAGDAVASLDYHVIRTCHIGLLRAYVAEAPHGHGERARALLTELETYGASRWTSAGQS